MGSRPTQIRSSEGFRSSNRESTTKLTVDQKATEENFFINNRIWGGIFREECFGTALVVSARKSKSIHIDGNENHPLLSNTSRRMTCRWRFVLTRLCNVTRESPRLSNEMQRLAVNRGSKRLEEVGSLVRNEHLLFFCFCVVFQFTSCRCRWACWPDGKWNEPTKMNAAFSPRINTSEWISAASVRFCSLEKD